MELKQNVAIEVPVRLTAVVDGSPQTGVTYDQVTCFIQKQGGASYQKVLGPTDWTEVDGVNMEGQYDLQLQASDLDTPGFLKYTVKANLCIPYPGLVQVRQSTADDLVTMNQAITRALGLMFENCIQDQQVFTQTGGLQSARVRVYDSRANALTAGSTGLLATYAVEGSFDQSGHATLFRMTRVS